MMLFLTKTMITLLAVILFYTIAFGILYLLDVRGGGSMKDYMKVLSEHPLALGVYLSARYVATLFSIGLIVCLVFLV